MNSTQQKQGVAGTSVVPSEESEPPPGFTATAKKKQNRPKQNNPRSNNGDHKGNPAPKTALEHQKPAVIARAESLESSFSSPDAERCVVCCDVIEYCSLGECGHRTLCGVCAFRLRTLHHDEKCVMCKLRLERVFIIRISDPRSHDELLKRTWGKIADGLTLDEHSQIFISNDCLEFKQQMDSLREARCGECPSKFANVRQLEKHLWDAHGKQLCKLCLEHRGLFLMEHARMTPTEFAQHVKTGDSTGKSSFDGHPSCKFCKNLSFYNTDGLYKHLNETHETCHLCAKSGTKYQYFRDYSSLEVHFSNAHFPCAHPRCRELKFVAFLTELQLQAHVAIEHPEQLDQRNSQINLDFVVKGSRRAGGGGGPSSHYDDEEFEGNGAAFMLSRTPSPFPSIGNLDLNQQQHGRNELDSSEFPRLGSSSASSVATSGAKTHYVQRVNNRSGPLSSDGLFGGLSNLAGPSAEQEVRAWCLALVSGSTSVQDFYDHMDNLLGPVALSAIFPDVQKLVGPDLGQVLDHYRQVRIGSGKGRTSSSASSSKRSSGKKNGLPSSTGWSQAQPQPRAAPIVRSIATRPVTTTQPSGGGYAVPQPASSQASAFPPLPAVSNPLVPTSVINSRPSAPIRLDDQSAFPTLSRASTSVSSVPPKLSKKEVREIAFSKKAPPVRTVEAPVGAKPLINQKKKGDLDEYDLRPASIKKKGGN